MEIERRPSTPTANDALPGDATPAQPAPPPGEGTPAPPAPHTRRRRWLQFSLRTLFVVVTLLAIPCWWIGGQAKIVRERLAIVAEIELAGGGVASWPFDDADSVAEKPAQLPWYRMIFGDHEVWLIILDDSMEGQVGMIRELFPEALVRTRSKGVYEI